MLWTLLLVHEIFIIKILKIQNLKLFQQFLDSAVINGLKQLFDVEVIMARELRIGGSHYDVRTLKRWQSLWRKNFEGAWAKSMYARGKKQNQNIHKINFTENLNNFNEITQHIVITTHY